MQQNISVGLRPEEAPESSFKGESTFIFFMWKQFGSLSMGVNRGQRPWRRMHRWDRGDNTVVGRAGHCSRWARYWKKILNTELGVGFIWMYPWVSFWLSLENFRCFFFILPPYNIFISACTALFAAGTKETLYRCWSISTTCWQRVSLCNNSAHLMFLFCANVLRYVIYVV